jgi:hypothetical protein
MKKSKMKPSMSGMGLQDEKLKPGKTKIIKAQMGRYAGELARKTYDNYQDQKRRDMQPPKESLSDRIKKQMQQDEQDAYRRRLQEYQAQREISRMPMQTPEDGMGQEAAQGAVGEAVGRKKGGMTKAQKKVGKVMREFKAGKLHSGKKGPVVKNPKQAIAIALSEAGQSKKKMMEGGMVRGSGAAIRGIKKARIY